MKVIPQRNSKTTFYKRPWFVLLTIIFFLLHHLKDHLGFIAPAEILILFAYYSAGFAILYLILYLFIKIHWKIFLFIFFCQLIYFFFAPFHNWLKEISESAFFSRYIFLLPFTLITLLIAGFYIRKKQTLSVKTFAWLNLSFLVFILTDVANITLQLVSQGKSISAINSNLKFSPIPDSLKRNVYYLVFDEYASSLSLKQRFNFDNPIDSILTKEGFAVIPKSVSNYNFTPFSIASTLNMSYLDGFKPDSITSKEYEIINSAIANNNVVNFLLDNNYRIFNLSIFDFDHHPSKLKSSFLPTGTILITRNTLFNHVLKDTEWFLYTRKSPFRFLYKKEVYSSNTNNNLILREFEKKLSSEAPLFVYAHFEMPHPPFYYNSKGEERSEDEVLNEQLLPNQPVEQYLNNVSYTNKKIEWLVNTIQSYEKGQAIIIIAGDHGFRDKASGIDHFRNFNAVYLPASVKSGFSYDSCSMANEFRYIFNRAFNQNLPILKDSAIFLVDYKH